MVDYKALTEAATLAAVGLSRLFAVIDARKAKVEAEKLRTVQTETKTIVQEVHVLTNSRMADMVSEVKSLKEELAAIKTVSVVDGRLSKIEAVLQALAAGKG